MVLLLPRPNSCLFVNMTNANDILAICCLRDTFDFYFDPLKNLKWIGNF